MGENIWNRNIFLEHGQREVGKPIRCKIPEDKHDYLYHVSKGSTVDTRWISATRRMSIAHTYQYHRDKDNKKNNQVRFIDQKPEDIMIIDYERLKRDGKVEYRDSADEEVAAEVRNKKDPMLKGFFAASQEIVFDTEVPAEYVRNVPQIFSNILLAIDRNQSPIGEIVAEALMDMIMQGKDVTSFLHDVKFTKFEGALLQCMNRSGEEAMSTREIAQTLFEDNSDGATATVQCMKVAAVKKIVSSDAFRGMIFDYISKDPKWQEFLNQNEKYIQKLVNYVMSKDGGSAVIGNECCDIIHGDIARFSVEKYQKLYKIRKSRADEKQNTFVIGSTGTKVDIDEGLDGLALAYDVRIDDKGNVTPIFLPVQRKIDPMHPDKYDGYEVDAKRAYEGRQTYRITGIIGDEPISI